MMGRFETAAKTYAVGRERYPPAFLLGPGKCMLVCICSTASAAVVGDRFADFRAESRDAAEPDE